MAETYSVEAILSAHDKGFSSEMQKALGSAQNLESGFNSSMGGMAKSFAIGQIAANAFMGVLGAVKNSVGALVGEMNDSQKAWSMFEGNMQMIGQSETEIQRVKSSLQDFATATIYSASDMASTYSQMAAIGVENTEALVKGMGGLAASAENPAQAMKSLSTQMVQALSQPEMKWADFRIMLEQAPAAMSEVAKHMGYSLDEFVLAVQDGEIASKDFAAAVAEVGTNEHFSKMATEFKTVDQALDGLQETVANKLMPAFEILNDIGIKGVEIFTDWIDSIDVDGLLGPLSSLAELFGIVGAEAAGLGKSASMSVEEIQGIADTWETMTLEEKQATVETMGQEDLSALLELLGVDFESIPDEYTKNAYLNAHGADALEELLWVTGTWHDLTLEEKRAVLEAQIENDELSQAIETMGMWEDAEFYSKLAEINLNDNDAEQQVLDLINQWAELNGLDSVDIEVNAKTKDAETGLGKFQKTFQRFSTAFGKVVDHLQTVGENIFEFAEPAFDFMSDLFDISLDTFDGYFTAFEKLIDGDWKGAWRAFKDTTTTAFSGVVDSLKQNVPKMWENIKGVASGIWQAFKNIDWGLVLSEINSFFGGIANSITSIDWYAVGAAVSGTIADLGIAIKGYIDDTFGDGKLGDMIMKAIKEMFDPTSDLNIDAGKFTNAVMRLLDGIANGISQAIGGFNITDVADVWKGKVTDFFEGLKTTWDNLVNTDWFKSFEMGTVLEDIKTAFSDGFANFEFGEIEFEWPEINWGSWAPLVEQFKTEVESVKAAIIEIFSNITLSDLLPKVEFKVPFGDLFKLDWETGSWEKVEVDVEVEANPKVEVKEDKGWIDSLKGWFNKEEQEVDVPVAVNPVPSVLAGEGIERDGSGAMGGMGAIVQSMIPTEAIPVQVPIAIELTNAGAAAVASVGGGLGESVAGGLDTGIAGQLAAQIQSAMTEANAIATAGMAQINSSVMSGFTQLITMTSSMMSNVNMQIAQGMARAVNAMRVGGMQMNAAFAAAGGSIVRTAQNISNQVVQAFNALSSRMYSAGVNAGAGFNSGLASQAGAIIGTANSIAQSVASAIQKALDIHSPSRLLAWLGRMAISGLVNGMEAMISLVSATSDKIAVAAVPDISVPDLSLSSSGSMSRSLVQHQVTSQSNQNGNLEAKLDEVIEAIRSGQVIMLDSRQISLGTNKHNNENLGKTINKEAYVSW